jgi:hypothetical protein
MRVRGIHPHEMGSDDLSKSFQKIKERSHNVTPDPNLKNINEGVGM